MVSTRSLSVSQPANPLQGSEPLSSPLPTIRAPLDDGEVGMTEITLVEHPHPGWSSDMNSLSPIRAETQFARYPSLNSAAGSVPNSPMSPRFKDYKENGVENGQSSMQGVFSFQPTPMSRSPLPKSVIGQRKGHKYKHSSVSHQIFLEPAPRAPLALPASLPMPTFKEYRKSMSNEQLARILWCLCHAFVAAYTLWSAQESLALTALSHLILYDALGATVCVVVDVLGNFEVWKRSSIRHPFGLERAEVLAGFAMSIFLLFMGIDLISHTIKHMLESQGNHEPHHAHHHDRITPGSVDLAALLAILSTLISAIVLQNHARIGKVMRLAYISALPSLLSNPSHFLTLSCSALLLLLPLLSIQMYIWLDRLLAGTMGASMCILGIVLTKAQGYMLLLSYSGAGMPQVISEILSDPGVSAVEEARFWQVHYGLCMANIKVRTRVTDEGAAKLREKIASLVRNRLGGGYGSGGMRWEVTTQMTLERNGY